MRRILQNILVTGGCGFIGSAFIRYLFSPKSAFEGRVVNMDAMTYAADPSSVSDAAARYGGGRYIFVKADICDRTAVIRTMQDYDIDTVVHFAAESHVDRSIADAAPFLHTNVMGTECLLDCAREVWTSGGAMRGGTLFHYVSTDEVYGSVSYAVTEKAALAPSSPYAASKAAGEHLCLAWHRTYGLPVTITRSSNNYGIYQYEEKFIPLMLSCLRRGKTLPVYGDGCAVRDWLHVDDHVRAIWLVVNSSGLGDVYNVAGGNLYRNIDLLRLLISLACPMLGMDKDDAASLIAFVPDRLGHDALYSMDCSHISSALAWQPQVPFLSGLSDAAAWYMHKGTQGKKREGGNAPFPR